VKKSVKFKMSVLVGFTASAMACGGGGEMGSGAAEAEPEAAPAAAEEPSGDPRVFFVAPRNETDHPTEIPLGITFGIENYEISPVPEEVTGPRGGMGHYHLGLNTECLPVGEVIPAADPWIHFGDGSDGMELTLEDGEYDLTVQLGDDEHRTLEGMCDTIVVRMESGI